MDKVDEELTSAFHHAFCQRRVEAPGTAPEVCVVVAVMTAGQEHQALFGLTEQSGESSLLA